MNENVEIKTLATYKKNVFRNEYTGYCVFQVLAADESKIKQQCKLLNASIICVGNVPEFRMETPLYIEGTVEKNQYGYQLNITHVEEKSWDVNGLAAYLCNICAGVGITTANEIAEAFCDTLFDVVKEDNGPDVLSAKCPLLSYESAILLCETIRNTIAQKAVYDEIFQYGGSWTAATKITKLYGSQAIKELHANPYAVGAKNGLPFQACDRIAKTVGLNATSPMRIREALIAAFKNEESQGHVYSGESDICKQARRIIKKSSFSEADIPSIMMLQALANDDVFVIDYDENANEGIYLKWRYRSEVDTAKNLMRLMHAAKDLNYNPQIVDWVESCRGIKYAPQQRQSFELIKKSGVAVITGGPGTGKTTTVDGLISAYEKLNPDKIIRLCAPTGRAAQRMTESTGREAVTIHRLLDFRPFGGDTVHKDASDPIVADLIVVDEASMLDIELAAIFLNAVKEGTLVLFIGDINQLPSVGPGDVLHDLIGSGKIPTVHLSTVYRQDAKSPIIENAKRINEGRNSIYEDDDYHYETYANADCILMRTLDLVKEMYDPNNPFDVQVLAPAHKGEAGVAMINNMLQNLLNPPNGQAEIKYGSRTYRVGDKVILLNNNYSSGYFNGDIGIIRAITEGPDIDIQGNILHLKKSEMEDLNLAYCMSVHKSQGSEFMHVIVTLPKKPSIMLKRNLLYTAITRAKKTVHVLAEEDAYFISIAACDTGKRNTRLAQRIQKML